jgi:hypothetical protein
MEHFNFGDFEEDGDESSRKNDIERIHRMMFIDDVERFKTQPISLSPNEFVDMFGNPEEEDYHILTQTFVQDYLRWSDKNMHLLIDKWGMEWIDYLRVYNVGKEEYELCTIFQEVYGEGKDYYAQLGIEQQIKDLLS